MPLTLINFEPKSLINKYLDIFRQKPYKFNIQKCSGNEKLAIKIERNYYIRIIGKVGRYSLRNTHASRLGSVHTGNLGRTCSHELFCHGVG